MDKKILFGLCDLFLYHLQYEGEKVDRVVATKKATAVSVFLFW